MSEPKTITFPFIYFLDNHCLGELDCVAVKPYSSTLIKATDPNEEHVHVQTNALEHLGKYDYNNPPEKVILEGEQLKLPLIWRKKSWDGYYPKIVAQKIQSFTDRKRANIHTENLARVVRWVKWNMKLPEESASKVAFEICKNPDKSLLKNLGIHIEDV